MTLSCDVVLVESGQSIVGADAPSALAFDVEGKQVKLRIKGKLNAEHPPKLDNDDYMLFQFPSTGLIQQTFVGKDPKRRVLLDDSIWLPLADGTSATDTELTVVLDTRSLYDLAWSKMHRLSVVDREDEAVADIKIANATLTALPQPVITKVEVVGNVKLEAKDKSNGKEHEKGNNGNHNGQNKHFSVLHGDEDESSADDEKYKYLRVEGRNFPVSIYAHWAQLNGVRIYAHATWVTNESEPKTVLFFHLPDGFTPKGTGENTFSYANPFGFKLTAF